MKQDGLIHLHSLMRFVEDRISDELDLDQIEDEIFSSYKELGLSPRNFRVPKSNQKEALMELSRINGILAELGRHDAVKDRSELTDIDDEYILERLGELYRDEGISRDHAKRKISRMTDMDQNTVCNKFSDREIYFGPHRHDNKVEAVQKLKDMSSRDKSYHEALEEVSEETDIPEGTLKNWLSDEGITFTEDISVILTDKSQEELIDTADHYFDTEWNVEPMEQALNRDRDTLRLYRENKIDTVPLKLLESLDKLFDSEPRYEMDSPESYIEERNGRGVMVEDGFQEYLFEHLTYDNFKGMTGRSTSCFNRYRNNKSKFIDEEAYRKVFQAVSHMYEKHPEPEIISYVDRNSYSIEGDLEESMIDSEEIKEELDERELPS